MITPKQAYSMTGFHSRKLTPKFEAEMKSVISATRVRSKTKRDRIVHQDPPTPTGRVSTGAVGFASPDWSAKSVDTKAKVLLET